jgi:AcrR family transcriptional regulator
VPPVTSTVELLMARGYCETRPGRLFLADLQNWSGAGCASAFGIEPFGPTGTFAFSMAQREIAQDDSPTRRRDAGRTRTDILDVATHEFAEQGFSGARVDEIAAQTETTKRMIYYYFGSKEQLYREVLERSYATIRLAENAVDVDALTPIEAIRRLAELTFDHHEAHPEFIRLVAVENIHRAEHLRQDADVIELNQPVIRLIGTILERGHADGSIRRDVEPVDLHMMISSFCVFRVANRHTFGVLFDRDLTDPSLRSHYRQMLGDLVVAYLRATDQD